MTGISSARRFTRRAWLKVVTAGATGRGGAALTPRIKAIAFDAFTIFDPRPITAVAEELFPGKGTDLANAWRTRQFEYTWLRTLTASYADFWQVTGDALVFAASLLKLHLSEDNRQRMMRTYLEFRAWPDAMAALNLLRTSGVRMALLSNFTEAMLDRAVQTSGLHGLFEANL